MIITTTGVAKYIGNIILAHYIKEEIWVKRIWHKINPSNSFKLELHQVISETISEYESAHQYKSDGIHFPFYHSQILIDILSRYVLFNDISYSVDVIKGELKANPNIIPPTNKDIDEFFSLFICKTKKSKKLEELYIVENYRTRIYEISDKIDNIIDILLKAELTSEIVINKLTEQVEYQIRKQTTSGKYIPATFVEIDELKDQLRYFVSPFFFMEKIVYEIKRMNFDYLRKKLNKRNQGINFDFNIDFIDNDNFQNKNDEFNKTVFELNNYLNEKHDELGKKRINATSSFTRKIENKIEDLKYIQARVIIVKGNAGQGKTNFLCDLADNVLLKRKIPTLFLTGYEIDGNDIFSSISKRLFPGNNYTFNDILLRINSYCESNNTFFILMIDGLNENNNPKKLSENIELFIKEILPHKHIKIILTCRTEYFKNNFQNISDSDFRDSIIQIESINEHLQDNHKRCLYESYCSYYNLKINQISDEIYEELVSNFLLLRIFAEANKGQNIAHLTHIYKEEIFQKYYSLKSKEINRRLNDNPETSIIGDFDIKNLFITILEYMIENRSYENIPFDSIIVKDTKNRDIYIRFLDENILLRKDVEEQNGIFGQKEFVNFTFDEFRDYLLTDYLINNLFENSKEKFFEFINENINNESRIKEGCISFIFSMERIKGNEELSSFIRQQDWYNEVFPYYIFDIKDEYVNVDDKLKLKEIFLSYKETSEIIIRSLAYDRWNESDFPNLNIQLLFEIFENLSDEEFEENVYFMFPQIKYDRYKKDRMEKLIERLEEILEKEDFNYTPYRHNIFQYILYFMPINRNIKYLYRSYLEKYNHMEHFEKLRNCKSNELKKHLDKFIQTHEIQL